MKKKKYYIGSCVGFSAVIEETSLENAKNYFENEDAFFIMLYRPDRPVKVRELPKKDYGKWIIENK